LRYEDKNAMAFGIETRLPYLDPQVMKLLLAQPPGKFFVDGWTKFPLRKCMDRHLPTAVVWRNGKMAFEGPHFVADATVRSTIKKSGILRTLKMEKPLLLGRTSWRQWVVAKWEQTFF
jgi:asparagine synthase (glutamine-hydrolysing)